MTKEVLLVEDSPGDVRLTRKPSATSACAIQLHVATDGVEAMAFLRHEGTTPMRPRPDLILLDLNLPKMDGREVLAQIKEDEILENDSDRRPDNLRRGSGHCKQLSTPSQLLPHQAGATGRVRGLGEKHHRFLAKEGQVAATNRTRMSGKNVRRRTTKVLVYSQSVQVSTQFIAIAEINHECHRK